MFFIFAALIFYTAAILLGAFASRRADTNLVAGITNAISAMLPLGVVLVSMARKPLQSQRIGLMAAVAGGVAIALFAMAINKSFTTDKVAIVTPVVFGGAIVLSTVLGSWLFREKITTVQSVGLILMTTGLVAITYAKATGK